ncbi:MAG: SH3 domain-containing protein [bacterium]
MKGKVIANRLNVRSAPLASAKKIGLLRQNAIVEILEEHDDWLEIRHNGGSAFVHHDFVTVIDAPITLKGQVTATTLNVRDRPNTAGNKIGTLAKGALIDILEEHGDWLEIGFNDESAFVHGDFVDLIESTLRRPARVTANLLNVRSDPGRSGRIVGQLQGDTVVNLVSQVGDWYEIKFNDSVAYVHGDYLELMGEQEPGTVVGSEAPVISPRDSQESELLKAPLQPEIKLPVTGTKIEKKVARTWNNFGGLLEFLSGAFKIDTASAIAVLCVESAGKGFEPTNENRMIVRFENHLFWKYWGKKNPEIFREHFQYGEKEDGKLKVWLGHRWRETADKPWRLFHGNQVKEWHVLEFARNMDDTAALFSISMGAPQIMGFNHAAIGFPTVQEMFDVFQQDIRNQIQGLFDFFDQNMIKALQDKDFVTFAGLYNGSGQKKKYGGWIHDHFDAFNQMALT